MKRVTLLREYLRTCRRVKLRPSTDGLKKVEYLRFIGADACPTCGEDVVLDAYSCNRDAEGALQELYHCPHCGAEFRFPRDVMH